VSQNPKGCPRQAQIIISLVLSPLIFFGGGLSSLMHILRSYILQLREVSPISVHLFRGISADIVYGRTNGRTGWFLNTTQTFVWGVYNKLKPTRAADVSILLMCAFPSCVTTNAACSSPGIGARSLINTASPVTCCQ